MNRLTNAQKVKCLREAIDGINEAVSEINNIILNVQALNFQNDEALNLIK
ncbi:hypothetical protein [Campylobacter californiensis]|nr:hypothetical protein [Campylobacter sp. RM12916]MBE3610535.1 hypothetical protein [Campylobacter sp. RM12916]